MSITAQYLATAVIGVKGTNVTSRPESSRVPGYPRASTLQEDSLVDSLERDAIGPWKALSRGHRRETAAGAGRMRRSLPTLRGRRDSLRPDPADPAGALAAVIAEAAAHFDSGPCARCPSGPACPSPRSGRRANLPGTNSRRTPADWRWNLNSCPANDALTLNVPFTSTRPYPAAGPPAGHDARLAPAAISAVLALSRVCQISRRGDA
jgi:hypothetical protein